MKLELKKINEAINAISNSIDAEQYVAALLGSEMMLSELEKYDNFNYSSYIWSRAIYKEVFDINNVAIINIGGRMYSCK